MSGGRAAKYLTPLYLAEFVKVCVTFCFHQVSKIWGTTSFSLTLTKWNTKTKGKSNKNVILNPLAVVKTY